MSELKYKVGDKVRLKSLDWFRNEGPNMVVIYMTKYYGEIVTINSVHKGFYRIKEDGGQYYWTDEMIECKVEEKIKLKFKKGDKIKDKNNRVWYVVEVYNRHFDISRIPNPKGEGTGYFVPMEDQDYYELISQCCLNDMEINEISLPNGYQFKDESGNTINATKIVLEKKKKEYPKTYEECAKIMNCPIDGPSGWLFNFDANIKDPYYRKIDILMGKFTRLLICRDAYWKIAGEEMGLGKPWEPDWRKERYIIYRNQDDIIGGYREAGCVEHHIFEFPTKEMRDAFYENFKEEIEICKKLL